MIANPPRTDAPDIFKGLIASVAGDAVDYVAGSVGFESAKGRLFRVFARRISFLGASRARFQNPCGGRAGRSNRPRAC